MTLLGENRILYKYRIWEDDYHKRLLTHNEIYLASPDQFNDPFDVATPFKYKKEDLTPENIFKKLLMVGKTLWPDINETELHEKCYERQKSGVFENDEYWKNEYQDGKSRMNQSFGVLSLTTKNDNLLMWSHYANSHTGFCVGLDETLLYNSIQGLIGNVIYKDEFPEMSLFEEQPIGMINLLMTKSKDWEYENEVRITKFGASRKSFTFPNETIKEVILGMKMLDSHKEEIIKLTKSKFPTAKLFDCQMNLEKYKIDLVEIYPNFSE